MMDAFILERALKVLKAGKRMFIDKSLAAYLADALAIFEAAKHYHVPVFSSSSLRFITGAKEIDEGRIGKILGAGKQLFKTIAQKFIKKGLKSIRERHLYLCKDLYKSYPQILRTVSSKSYLIDFKNSAILRTLSAELDSEKIEADMDQLLTSLSFSHFIELLKADTTNKRQFYEMQTIKNNWGVRDLKEL